jgi:hypothetical protein
MKHTLLKTLLTGTVLSTMLTFSASASVINTDWNNVNDRLVITDTDTGNDFLKLTATSGMTINDVQAQLGTAFLGWRFATIDEVGDLLVNIYSPYGYTDSSSNVATIHNNLYWTVDTLGLTSIVNFSNAKYRFSFGKIKDGGSSFSAGVFSRDYFDSQQDGLTIYLNVADQVYMGVAANEGVWLIRGDISDVPAPLAFSSLALLGFGLVRRKKSAI